MRSEILTKNGINIYYLDFSNLRELKEIEQVIEETSKYIRKQPESSVLTLTNAEGMHFNNSIRDVFTTFIKGNKPYVKAGAVIGLNGLMQIVYNGMLSITGRNLKAFKDKQDAIDYLILKNNLQ